MGFHKEEVIKIAPKIIRSSRDIYTRTAIYEALNSYYGLFTAGSVNETIPSKCLAKLDDEPSEYNRMLMYNIMAHKLHRNPNELKLILKHLPRESDFLRLYIMLILHHTTFSLANDDLKLVTQVLTEASLKDPLKEAREVAFRALEDLKAKDRDYESIKRADIKAKIESLESLIRNHDSEDKELVDEITNTQAAPSDTLPSPLRVLPPKATFNGSSDDLENEICQICKRMILPDQKWVECPHCHRRYHENHFAEWLKIKGSCPVCRRRLKERGLLA
ncbi:MAG: E3 ubiquitin protein ligase [Asgard group archaeon]|nr:E3 ubiquitin protein ligase [Asgard group archaeon]